jgi:hypothetical protein
MNESNKISPKISHQPAARTSQSLKPMRANNTTALDQRSSSQSDMPSHLSKTSVAQESQAVEAIHASKASLAPASHSVAKLAGIDLAKLRSRITSCLALQSDAASSWAVSMPLHESLAPQSRMRLECDINGQLTLQLYSKLPAVVNAMSSEIPSLKSSLKPLSHGLPVINVLLDDSM